MVVPSRQAVRRYAVRCRSVRAYKFLDAQGRAPFTATSWTHGEWVVTTAARPCREGVHACRAVDIAHWLADSLWEVELGGEIVDSRHKVVASRGRLVRLVDRYPDVVRELAEVGAWRCRDRAVVALQRAGDAALAERFAGITFLDALVALGAAGDDGTWAGSAAALAADAAHFALHGNRAQSPFVAACSAGHFEAGPDGGQVAYDTGYATERDFQSAWLTDHLGLV
jgi:hypothetical protein